MATRNWTGTVDTDMNDGANYDGSGSILTTDDLVFSSGSGVTATATAHLHVNSLTINDLDYTAGEGFDSNSYTITVDGDLYASDTLNGGGSSVNFDNLLMTALSGSATLYLNYVFL